MIKIVIAPDKFKGSLTGIEFCNAVEQGIRKHSNDVEIVKLPLADGGDGTVEALRFYTGGDYISLEVSDPLDRKIKANYLFSPETQIAFIEMAEASGIRLLESKELNPLQTSTYGTGELIKNAIERGAKHIIIGIGGSSTNDAGMGMARALGYRFLDQEGNELEGRGRDLEKLHSIDSFNRLEALADVRFEVACDVDNPLFGPHGAAKVYSPQKGASPEVVQQLDSGLQNFNSVVNKQFGFDLQSIPGTGAAGGLGAGCILFLNAELQSGIKLIKDIANFENNIANAHWIITGEGKFDEQTFSGKVIKGVLESRTNQKLAVFCGLNELKHEQIQKYQIDYLAEMMGMAKNLDDSITNSATYLVNAAEKFAQKHIM